MVIDIGLHFQEQQSLVQCLTKRVSRNSGDLPLILSELYQTAPRVWNDSWYPQARNLRSNSSQRILGENVWENNGVSRNDHICCMLDCQNDTKTAKRTISIMREKRACSLCNPNSILCCTKVHWSLAKVTIPGAFASFGDLSYKHTYWFKTRLHNS